MTGKLVGMIAHDLRTPLSSIILHLELLEGAQGLDDEERQDVVFALASARALTEAISVAVGATRGVEPAPAEHDLAVLLRQAIEQQPGHGSSRAVEVVAPEALLVRVDPTLMLRAIRQMLRAAEAVTPPDRPIRVRLAANGPRVRMEVVDEGATVPEELRESMFDAAGAVEIRTHHRALSRGLGPVFCRRVAEALGGAAGIEPVGIGAEPRGNLAWLEIPLGSTAAPA